MYINYCSCHRLDVNEDGVSDDWFKTATAAQLYLKRVIGPSQ